MPVWAWALAGAAGGVLLAFGLVVFGWVEWISNLLKNWGQS